MHINDGVVEEVRPWSVQGCFHLTCSFRRSSPSGVLPPLVLSSLLQKEVGVNEGETLVKTSCLLIRSLMARSPHWAEADLNPGLSARSQLLHGGCACCSCVHVCVSVYMFACLCLSSLEACVVLFLCFLFFLLEKTILNNIKLHSKMPLFYLDSKEMDLITQGCYNLISHNSGIAS